MPFEYFILLSIKRGLLFGAARRLLSDAVSRQTMVIPEERDGRTDDNVDLARDVAPANATVNTRQGGGAAPTVQQKV